MTSRYLIRLDDACNTMYFEKWKILEKIFINLNIKPLVAVIPNNKDKSLIFKKKNYLFWKIVRRWKNLGWTIAMHGYQHLYHDVPKKKLILPFYNRSEFGGLSLQMQSEKIKNAYNLFKKNKIQPKVWIAPSHSFDITTLKALKKETSIRIISDGIAFDQFFEFGFFWIPQQLWEFKDYKKGLWTICLHPNTMSYKSIYNLKNFLKKNKKKIVNINNIIIKKRKKNFLDIFFSFYFWKKKLIFEILIKTRYLLLKY